MIKFTCQGGGECCKSRGDGYQFVWLVPEDIPRLAEYLNLSEGEFLRQHCVADKGQFRLDPQGTCKFLNGRRCTVHKARPYQCRVYPFSELQTEERWAYVSKMCPGIGQGREYTETEIFEVLEEGREI